MKANLRWCGNYKKHSNLKAHEGSQWTELEGMIQGQNSAKLSDLGLGKWA